ncbi:carboxy terminal-processing peptidase [Halomonas sp. HP20-15]|uniref:carboxy terminal-processing peptidase n=1 Tax=Halomonas sp. HP20-15 TaxID=3085901 RepID=UPI002981903B|nr:carboxy terminal-processing peptidase [Halomonas sp. HP20-15]MDW5378877.1 carboxy terminal-processing peptidase [Halomonas sp. HP20-15]
MSLTAAIQRVWVLCLLIALSVPAFAGPSPSPTDAQRQAAVEVAESLNYGHYADVKLDDAWSQRAFDRLLDVLDPQRAYLLKRDIAAFDDLRGSIDEAVNEGRLERVYALYERYQSRLEARLEWLLAQLENGLDFDYTSNERLVIDRQGEPWAGSQEALDRLWHKRLKNAALSLSLSDQSKQEIRDTLVDRYEGQLSRLRQTNPEDVFELFMAAVTGTVDPHTEYFSPRQGESFDIQMRLSLEGIGALLQTEGEYVKVSSLVPGGPADKGGVLQPADRIVGVGQGESGEMVNVVGMRLDDVVELIRGPKGTTVRLDVIPAKAVDVTRSHVVKIVRDTVKLEDQAASSEVIEVDREDGKHRIGVIDIPTFYVDFDAWQAGEDDYRSSTRDVAKEIAKLKAADVEGILLDLRNNGGGALQEANSLIGLFIDRGPTVQVRDARGRISLYGDTDSGVAYSGPLGVLVNRLSASASEILAGAIQDYDRGLIIGSQTFGKGTVQTLSDLSHGQVKLTRAKFYRVSGESTQLRGVSPDISFPSLVDPDMIGESTLDNALPWDTVRAVQYRDYGNPQRYLDTLKARHETRVAQDPNFTYLEEQAALFKTLRDQQTTISLNREQRQREMNAQENEQLALENRRRRALGLEPLDNWAETRDSAASQQNAEDEEAADPVDRAQVIEGSEIVLDYAQLSGAS